MPAIGPFAVMFVFITACLLFLGGIFYLVQKTPSPCETVTYLAQQQRDAIKICRDDANCMLGPDDYATIEYLQDVEASCGYVEQ